MRFRRLLPLALCLALLLTTLVGCADAGPTLRIYTWEDYISPELIDAFEQQTGIHVVTKLFDTNESMYTKIKSGTVNYDVVFPSDYMIERMISEDMLAELDWQVLGGKQQFESFTLNLPFDPDNRYSVPYMWGTLGILYDTTQVTTPVDSWEVLWDEQYKNRIMMIDSVRDALGIALITQGYSLNDFSDTALQAAEQKMLAQKSLLYSYESVDSAKNIMARGNAAAMAVVYTGEALVAMEENPNLAYVVPKEGSNIWFDNVVVMKNSKMQAEAMEFIAFLCQYDNACANTEYIQYFSPIAGVNQDLIGQGKLLDLLPTEQNLQHLEAFCYPGTENNQKLDQVWTNIKSR